MSLSEQEKQLMLKAFTNLLKSINGRGPKNIYVKYEDDVIQFVMQGVVSDFEKYLIKNFGEEAIKTFTDYYERDSYNFEKALNQELDHKYQLKFLKLDSDFQKDSFTYHMKIERTQLHT